MRSFHISLFATLLGCIAPEETIPTTGGPTDGLLGVDSHNCDVGLVRTGDFVTTLGTMSGLGRGIHQIANALVLREPQNAWAEITFDLETPATGAVRSMSVTSTCGAPGRIMFSRLDVDSLAADEYQLSALGIQSICSSFLESVVSTASGEARRPRAIDTVSNEFVSSDDSELGYFRLRQIIDEVYAAEILYNRADGCVLRSLEQLSPL